VFELAIKLVSSSGFCGTRDSRATISDAKGPCSSDRLPNHHATQQGIPREETAALPQRKLLLPTYTSSTRGKAVAHSSRCCFRCATQPANHVRAGSLATAEPRKLEKQQPAFSRDLIAVVNLNTSPPNMSMSNEALQKVRT
jgi:hypothetical protein